VIDPALARRFCETLARGLAYQDIRPALDTPYLRRYFVAGWQPRATKGPAVFLHHFVSSDPDDAVHSHPWEFGLSLILVGGYVEHRATANGGPSSTRTYGPGDTNILEPGDRHRIDLLGRDCWSLFLAGEYAQPWGFYELT
jgi:hypothetical protein